VSLSVERDARHLWWLVREHAAAVAAGDTKRIDEILEAINIHGELTSAPGVKTACERIVGRGHASVFARGVITTIVSDALGESPRLH